MLTITGLFADGGRIRKGTLPDRFRYASIDTETPVFDYIEFPTSNHMLARDPDCTMRLWGLFLSYSKRYLQKHEEHGDILSE